MDFKIINMQLQIPRMCGPITDSNQGAPIGLVTKNEPPICVLTIKLTCKYITLDFRCHGSVG